MPQLRPLDPPQRPSPRHGRVLRGRRAARPARATGQARDHRRRSPGRARARGRLHRLVRGPSLRGGERHAHLEGVSGSAPRASTSIPTWQKYAAVSKEVMAILRRFTDVVEPVSIDEAFLDVTQSRRAFGDGERIGRALKDAIRNETRLTASVGVATSKLVAKVASDMRKPDGLVVVPPGEEAAFLAPLPVRRLWGVGPKMEEQLARLGVVTIGDLAACPRRSSNGAWARTATISSGWPAERTIARCSPSRPKPRASGPSTPTTRTRAIEAACARTLMELADTRGAAAAGPGPAGANRHPQVPRRDVPHRDPRGDPGRSRSTRATPCSPLPRACSRRSTARRRCVCSGIYVSRFGEARTAARPVREG